MPKESITFVVKGKLSTICSCCFQSRLNCTGSHKLFTAQTSCHDLLGGNITFTRLIDNNIINCNLLIFIHLLFLICLVRLIFHVFFFNQ